MNKIIIKNARRIKHLEFSLPERKGVYLLVSPNGGGKSTFLTILHKICNGKAFAEKFKSSSRDGNIDDFRDTEITYICKDGTKATFRKGEKRWVSKPKDNRRVLENFGYESSCFIEADPKRIAIKNDEIKLGKRIQVADEIKTLMCDWFSEEDFRKLEKLKNAKGRGRGGEYFYIIEKSNGRSYSEKHFSTGELAIVRLLTQIDSIAHNSLLLFDEAELALHPKVQLKLLEYLREKSEKKDLTVFVATHSVPMIENTDPNNIFLLEKSETKPISPCYPALALGSVLGLDYSNSCDAIIFVEDEMAKLVLEKLRDYCIKIGCENRVSQIFARIYPVGGYIQTADLANKVKASSPNKAFVRAVLDHDVYERYEKEKSDPVKKYEYHNFMEEHKQCLCDLGCVPERDIISCITSKTELKDKIKRDYKVDPVSTTSKVRKNGKGSTIYKKQFKELLQRIAGGNVREEEAVKHELVEKCIPFLYPEEKARQIIGKIFAAQKD